MFLKNRVYLFFVLIGFFTIASCKKAPNYPNVPVISFNSIQVVPYAATSSNPTPVDSINITFNFQDGNGDIGNKPAQTNDYFVNAYKKVNGTFQVFNADTAASNYNGNLPLLSPYNVTGPINGTITNSIGFPYIVPNFFGLQRFDTIMFQIRIKDRNNDTSNWIQTTPVVLWQDPIFN